MNKQGEVIQVGAVRFERRLPGDVERVWSHLTDCEKLINWFGDDGTIEPREGGAVKDRGEYVTRNAALYGVDLNHLER